MSKKDIAKIAYELLREKTQKTTLEIFERKDKLLKLNNKEQEDKEKANLFMIGSLFGFSNDIEEKYQKIINKYERIISSLLNEDK